MTVSALPRSSALMRSPASRMRLLGGSLRARILRVPLLGKILGANCILVLAALLTRVALPAMTTTAQLTGVLVLSFAATTWLVWLALRPVMQLQVTAQRVSGGDFSARVPESPLADRSVGRLAATMNRLLDRVESDRARIHYLAGRSVRARDVERELLARELRDSFAQSLAAVSMQLSAAIRGASDAKVMAALERTRETVQQLTDEMRTVAETLYPGTLGEFGLVNAIEALARRVARRSGLPIHIDAEHCSPPLSATVAGAMYRVADEALRNVEQHACASHARVTVRCADVVTLEVEDDGRGVDMRSTDPLQAGLGLFSAKTVLALAGGELHIFSGPGLGTRVVARAPTGEPTGHP